MKQKRSVAIVHYNTPELTEAAIMSLRKHGGEQYDVVVFDNSDTRPFKKKMPRVKVIDNTKGQVIDFEKELEKFPDRDTNVGCVEKCYFGSDKHMMTVQKLWEILPDGFVLMDSDVLVKKSIEPMFNYDECAVGHIWPASNGPTGPVHERFVPFLLWINVPMCIKGGARFFDPTRTWALHKGFYNNMNKWDTGAAFLEDIRKKKPLCHGRRVDINEYVIHMGGASYRNNNPEAHQQWLEKHRDLWAMPKPRKPGEKRYTVITYIFGGYEKVHEVEVMDDDAEYIMVTDDPKLTSKTWKVIRDKDLNKKSLNAIDKTFYVRYHLFKYAKTDYVVRIDGSVAITKSLDPLVDMYEAGGYDMALMIHPQRRTMPEEYRAWVSCRNYPKEDADRMLPLFRRMGHPDNYRGLFQTCFGIYRKNDINDVAHEITWALKKIAGRDGHVERIDQTIFSVVLARMLPQAKIMPVSERIMHNSYFEWYCHNSYTPTPIKNVLVEPYMFDKPIQTVL